ncbi:MAG: LCP family protein [Clostridiales bacterium]|nr:LCP family protein [Clostridiales bacterium]
MSKVRKVILVILAVLSLMVIGAYAFLQAQLNKINRVTASETEYTTEDFEEDTDEEDTIDSSTIDYGTVDGTVTAEGIINVLLVGQDTRVSGQRARSDTMIILTIDNVNGALKMTSIMRDLYVQIPGYSDNKINAAYAFGGFDLLDSVIETNFGITIDYNIEVDFTGFQEIIDAIGGISIKLTQGEVNYLSGNSKYSSMGDGNSFSGLTVGYNLLNGEEALAYARIRYVNTEDGSYSDFGRTQRQRTVIQTVFQQLKDEDFNDLWAIYETVADDITTDMNNDEILSVALSAYNLGVDSIEEYRIPEDGSYSSQTIRKMAVLVPTNWDLLRANLQEFIYGTSSAVSSD